MTLCIFHFTADVVRVSTIGCILVIIQVESCHCTRSTFGNYLAGIVYVNAVTVGVVACHWACPCIAGSKLRTVLLPYFIFTSISVVEVDVPVLGKLNGCTDREVQVIVFLVGCVCLMDFRSRASHFSAVFVITHRIESIPTIHVKPWVGSSRVGSISITLVTLRIDGTCTESHILVQFCA